MITSQNEMILKYLREHYSITQAEATQHCACTRLPSRIHDLKRAGNNIIYNWVTAPNRFGRMVRFKEYMLVKGDQA